MKPSIGRIVHFVLNNGQHRPADIVIVHPGTEREELNLHLKVDPVNDTWEDIPFQFESDEVRARINGWKYMGITSLPPIIPLGSIPRDEETKAPGTWHEPERV